MPRILPRKRLLTNLMIEEILARQTMLNLAKEEGLTKKAMREIIRAIKTMEERIQTWYFEKESPKTIGKLEEMPHKKYIELLKIAKKRAREPQR